jgi:pimeloyl-ACP methyl ester carboxylesterase
MLHFRTYGNSGPEIILLHGGPGAPGEIAPIGRELADSFRLVEPFQRSSGAKPLTVAGHVADLHDLVTARGTDRKPILIGFSWGAMLALAYAEDHPGSAGPLILVGCGTFDERSRDQLKRTLAVRMAPEIHDAQHRASLLPREHERLRTSTAACLPLYAYAPVTDNLELEHVDARGHEESWSDMLRLQADGTYPAAFASIKAPALMLHGDFDLHAGPLIHASLQPYMPQLTYRELARCGHYPWIEKYAAAQFYASIREWLASSGGLMPGT